MAELGKHCPSDFSHFCHEIPDKKQLRREGVFWPMAETQTIVEGMRKGLVIRLHSQEAKPAQDIGLAFKAPKPVWWFE